MTEMRLLSLLLALCLLLTAGWVPQADEEPAEPTAPVFVTAGDVNGDGSVNASDALLALQHSVKLIALQNAKATSADVNGDTAVNAADALLILQFSVRLVNVFLAPDSRLGLAPATEDQVFSITPQKVLDYREHSKEYPLDDYSFTHKSKYITTYPKPLPVHLAWTRAGEKPPAALTLCFSESEDMSAPDRVAVDPAAEEADVYNLKVSTRYFWRLEAVRADGLTEYSDVAAFSTADGIRILKVKNLLNIRDIGGQLTADGERVRQGLVFRSEQMDDKSVGVLITDETRKELVGRLGVRVDYDLRGSGANALEKDENGVLPSPLGPGVRYVGYGAQYYDVVIEKAAHFGKELAFFADPDNYPVLFHCAAGADRTGTLAFMLEALLGMSESDCVLDYELTFGRDRTAWQFPDMMALVHEMEGETLQQKIYRFCKEDCGLSVMQLANIRNLLLNDDAVFCTDCFETENRLMGDTDPLELHIDPRQSGALTAVKVGDRDLPCRLTGDRVSIQTESLTAEECDEETFFGGVIPIYHYNGTLMFENGSTLPFEITLY